jgi:cytochrome P450
MSTPIAGIFSSDVKYGGISLRDVSENYNWPSFIAMDEPKHGPQRKTVQPIFTPVHLDRLALLIRERSATILDNLPRNETFNWVDRVSIELTTQMLATLFDFPWEDRRMLTRWSDLSTALPKAASMRRRAAPARSANAPTISHACGTNASEPGQRPDLDDGAQRRHARDEPG